MLDDKGDFGVFLEKAGAGCAVLLCSMLPIIERAVPFRSGPGWGYLWQNYLLAVLGNMLPVPFILLFIRKIIYWMQRSKIRFFNRFAAWLDKKAVKKSAKIEKCSFWGLCLFVAIPLPLTGAWTGSLAAATVGMRFKTAIVSVLLGVLIAGVIMSLGSYGLVAAFRFFAG